MKIIKIENSVHSFKIIPRVYPYLDNTLIVKMRNEMTNEEEEISHSFSYSNDYLELTVDPTSGFLKLNSKYQLSIFKDDINIYQGRVFVISENDSIQDYKKTEITANKKLKF